MDLFAKEGKLKCLGGTYLRNTDKVENPSNKKEYCTKNNSKLVFWGKFGL